MNTQEKELGSSADAGNNSTAGWRDKLKGALIDVKGAFTRTASAVSSLGNGNTCSNSRSKPLEEPPSVVSLQVGRQLWRYAPKDLRLELWMSSLHSKTGRQAADGYVEYLAKEVQAEAAADIAKDIPRSFPNTVQFHSEEGQASLRSVLLAYAAYDPEVGYCQGMNFLTGLLLMYLPSEAHAFAALVVLMEERGLKRFYSRCMSLLQVQLWQLGKLMSPKLNAHLESHGVVPMLYASSWLMTCFSADFPISFSARIMDVMLSDRCEFALLKVAVTILRHTERRLRNMTDLEQIVNYLKISVPGWVENRLDDILTEAFSKPWTQRQLEVLNTTDGVETVAQAMDRVLGSSASGIDASAVAASIALPDEEAGVAGIVMAAASTATGRPHIDVEEEDEEDAMASEDEEDDDDGDDGRYHPSVPTFRTCSGPGGLPLLHPPPSGASSFLRKEHAETDVTPRSLSVPSSPSPLSSSRRNALLLTGGCEEDSGAEGGVASLFRSRPPTSSPRALLAGLGGSTTAVGSRWDTWAGRSGGAAAPAGGAAPPPERAWAIPQQPCAVLAEFQRLHEAERLEAQFLDRQALVQRQVGHARHRLAAAAAAVVMMPTPYRPGGGGGGGVRSLPHWVGDDGGSLQQALRRGGACCSEGGASGHEASDQYHLSGDLRGDVGGSLSRLHLDVTNSAGDDEDNCDEDDFVFQRAPADVSHTMDLTPEALHPPRSSMPQPWLMPDLLAAAASSGLPLAGNVSGRTRGQQPLFNEHDVGGWQDAASSGGSLQVFPPDYHQHASGSTTHSPAPLRLDAPQQYPAEPAFASGATSSRSSHVPVPLAARTSSGGTPYLSTATTPKTGGTVGNSPYDSLNSSLTNVGGTLQFLWRSEGTASLPIIHTTSAAAAHGLSATPSGMATYSSSPLAHNHPSSAGGLSSSPPSGGHGSDEVLDLAGDILRALSSVSSWQAGHRGSGRRDGSGSSSHHRRISSVGRPEGNGGGGGSNLARGSGDFANEVLGVGDERSQGAAIGRNASGAGRHSNGSVEYEDDNDEYDDEPCAFPCSSVYGFSGPLRDNSSFRSDGRTTAERDGPGLMSSLPAPSDGAELMGGDATGSGVVLPASPPARTVSHVSSLLSHSSFDRGDATVVESVAAGSVPPVSPPARSMLHMNSLHSHSNFVREAAGAVGGPSQSSVVAGSGGNGGEAGGLPTEALSPLGRQPIVDGSCSSGGKVPSPFWKAAEDHAADAPTVASTWQLTKRPQLCVDGIAIFDPKSVMAPSVEPQSMSLHLSSCSQSHLHAASGLAASSTCVSDIASYHHHGGGGGDGVSETDSENDTSRLFASLPISFQAGGGGSFVSEVRRAVQLLSVSNDGGGEGERSGGDGSDSTGATTTAAVLQPHAVFATAGRPTGASLDGDVGSPRASVRGLATARAAARLNLEVQSPTAAARPSPQRSATWAWPPPRPAPPSPLPPFSTSCGGGGRATHSNALLPLDKAMFSEEGRVVAAAAEVVMPESSRTSSFHRGGMPTSGPGALLAAHHLFAPTLSVVSSGDLSESVHESLATDVLSGDCAPPHVPAGGGGDCGGAAEAPPQSLEVSSELSATTGNEEHAASEVPAATAAAAATACGQSAQSVDEAVDSAADGSGSSGSVIPTLLVLVDASGESSGSGRIESIKLEGLDDLVKAAMS